MHNLYNYIKYENTNFNYPDKLLVHGVLRKVGYLVPYVGKKEEENIIKPKWQVKGTDRSSVLEVDTDLRNF